MFGIYKNCSNLRVINHKSKINNLHIIIKIMSQSFCILEKIESETQITNTELSMLNDSESQNSDVFQVIYNHRQKIIEKSRKDFYLSRRRFLRKQRKQDFERKKQSFSNNLRKQREMELIESFISLEGSCSNFSSQNQEQIQREISKSKDFLYQNSFVPFEYNS